MGFTYIQTYQFRNLYPDKIQTDAQIVYLTGKNGQGKTNFLEAVYLLCFGSSFRTKNNTLLIKQGEEEMSTHGKFIEKEAQDLLSIGVKIKKNKKRIEVNGKVVKDRKELIQNVPCIVFSHEDIYFVKGTPDEKRFFFNQTLSLFKPSFIDTLRKFNKVLKMRNLEIKNRNYKNIDIYDIQLAELGLLIQKERSNTTVEFNATFENVYRTIHRAIDNNEDTPIQIRYAPSWKNLDGKDEVLAHLCKKRDEDKELGCTTTGPHRDRFVFWKNGKNFTLTASTGQFRLAALILRVAQALFFTSKTERKPVLLLDDVLLELDGSKKEAFLRALPEFEQAFFTFLPEENYCRFYSESDVLVYSVNQGKLNHEKSR